MRRRPAPSPLPCLLPWQLPTPNLPLSARRPLTHAHLLTCPLQGCSKLLWQHDTSPILHCPLTPSQALYQPSAASRKRVCRMQRISHILANITQMHLKHRVVLLQDACSRAVPSVSSMTTLQAAALEARSVMTHCPHTASLCGKARVQT